MGSSRPAALLLPLLLILIDLSDSAGIGCPHLPHWNTRGPLASHMDDSFTASSAHIPCRTWWACFSTKRWCARVWHCSRCLCQHLLSGHSGLQWSFFGLLVQKSKKSSTFKFCRKHKIPAPAQRKLLLSRCLSEKSHHISIPSPDISHKAFRSKRTQPSDPEAWKSLPRLDSQRHRGPEFSFDLLHEARAIRVTIPSGPEVSVRLCHQWALQCEELSSPYDVQKIVSGGHTVELSYEFLLPCLCIEASYLQEDTVRRKRCPFQSWPEAYGSDFWKSVHFTDYSQHTQMVMAVTLRCPLKLEAALCQRHDWHTLCKDFPNATAQESEGWYVLEKVDLHPQLCFKFSFGNSSHVECPHQTGSLTSWNVSMDTQAQQLILHFSSRTHATFSAAWSHEDLGQDTLVPPVYTVSQAQGSSPVTLDLIIPFLRPGCCVLVWRSDVQFAWKHLLCPDVSNRHLGLLILALLAFLALLGVVLALTCRRRPQSGRRPARPVLLLHTADSEAQRRLVGALAELLRAALGSGRNVIVDLWEGRHVARVGSLPWLWAARERVAREQGTVLLLWSSAGLRPTSDPNPRTAPLLALLHAAPRPLLLLAYFSRLCAEGDIPQPLRALPRYRLLRDLPRLLRALDAQPSAEATSWGLLGALPRRRSRLELCSQLEREVAQLADLG
ncbi:interleukin-17 receptor E isoform X1 [Saimiri boliviensis]|uniref:Interleukin-17 receptor E n=1 Tax=Saimiri boliviensis boliviensis TaxID=39432 RepID=A0A2K6V1U0_SAIBB|nr:interleukin-17 receptor E isoform X1 [Saimiri boliviensis boliviensis]XP_010336094.1 interleukin-17 receptor E isoform X1 [Saimiri boliviensis boliviensis]XP_010336096.1 interleukin-17 receptor E isoform X1 [Saimiri boliviensis boliviensis]